MEYNNKQIGRNIKAIRNANNKSYLDFAADIGISESLLQKIETDGRHVTDAIIQIISEKTGFPFNDIKYKDLSNLEKRELCFDEELTWTQFTEEADLLSLIVDALKYQFPIVEDEKALENEEFNMGIQIVRERIHSYVFSSGDCIKAINHFIHARKTQTCADLSAINILSCFGYLYFATVLLHIPQQKIESLIKKRISSHSDFWGATTSCVDQNVLLNSKRVYLDKYDKFLTTYMKKLASSEKNSDYAYYFLGLRYYLGIMDEKITLLDDHQMRLFGESMLDSLWKMGNKYAKALHDQIESL